MLDSRSAALLSVLLSLPILFVVVTAMLNYEPPFVQQVLTEPDGFTPTRLARLFMLVMLGSVPVAFVLNLLAMFNGARAQQAKPFRLTPAYALVGLAILLLELMVFSPQVLRELTPFVRPLGSAAVLGQVLCLVGMLLLPVAFLFNRLPHFARPASINLIVGAALRLMILLFITTFALEATACAIGVPNCD